MSKKKIISIVISAYNEEENINELIKQIYKNTDNLVQYQFELLFVNDGSTDRTFEKVYSHYLGDKKIKIVNFSRNFGHEIAMRAGMDYAHGDCVIFMDADLQHDPEVLPKLIQKWQEGSEIVLTKRLANEDKKYFHKILNFFYYKLLNFFSTVPVQSNAPDFRLIDKKYINELKKIKEQNFMFRSLLFWIKQKNFATVSFKAPSRFAGKSKYNLIKLFSLGVDSIIQFSTKPLFISYIFAIIGFLVTLVLVSNKILHIVFNLLIFNTSSMSILIIFTATIVCFLIGILGDYIGRIHHEVKGRPLYIAEYFSNDESHGKLANEVEFEKVKVSGK